MRIALEEAEGKLSELIGKVVFGGERQIIITKRGMPVAKLMDYYAPPLKTRIGVAKGQFSVPDDFDADNEEIAKLFGLE